MNRQPGLFDRIRERQGGGPAVADVIARGEAVRCRAPGDLVPLRGLTLWRPWPWSMHGAVLREDGKLRLKPGVKPIENRGWHPPEYMVGAWVATHSGKHFDRDAVDWLRRREWDYGGPYPDSCITGVGILEREFGRCDRGCDRCRCRLSTEPGTESRFYMGAAAWVISHQVPLIEPVPCKEAMGLWRLPEDAERAVRSEYARSVRELGDQLPPGPRMNDAA